MSKILSTIFPLLFTLTSFAQSPARYDSIYTIQDTVLIPTRSGIPISAIIVRKTAHTRPLPALLFYTTYYQGLQDNSFGKRSADRDYVGVVAYARGIRANLNNYAPYEHEGTDVYDIVDWISKQPWSNGKVGMYGGSYTGYAQWATAKRLHPALKTIVPQVAVMPGYDAPMENNVPYGNVLGWANDQIYKNKPYRRNLYFDWFEQGTSFRCLDSLGGIPNPIFQLWLNHPAYDAYWQAMVPTPAEYANINIPVLSTTGYYDGSQIGAMQYFKLHHTYNQRANHYLVIGPYDHWGGQRKPAPNLMDYQIDSVANISMGNLAYEWLDWILKDGPKPALLRNKINYQVMGTNKWKHVASLKDMNNDTLVCYLNNNLVLDEKRPAKEGFVSQVIDFKDRENQHNYYTPSIVFDSLDASNGIVYTSNTFNADFSINGSFVGQLYASINKKDMDISMALYEQQADGKYFFLTRYVGRASYANDNTRRQLLSPNQKIGIPFNNTRMVSKKISKGSRLIILLNINKHPFEIINYGSGKDPNDETILDAKEPLHIKWHNDSYIKIPVCR